MVRRSEQARILDLAAAFTDLGPAWGRWVTVCTPVESVSYIRLRLLRVLEQEGDCTMTQLACSLNLAQRRITDLTAALVNEGFIERRPNPNDGRSSVISLTATGRAHLDRAWPEFQNEIAAAFSALPAELQKQLLAITPLLTGILRERTATRMDRVGPGRPND
jgi:DNA-binding MarR family transcriptional regulator